MQPVKVIDTIELFPVLHEQLVSLLEELTPDQWQSPTVLRGWCVKDIASHIIDGHFRRVALYRDRYIDPNPPRIDSYQSLVDYLNQLNHDWVIATRRISPAQLLDWLRQVGPEVYQLFKTLPPHDAATFSVAWAGEESSQNWFHIAREYTELWHHQQQIRLAVDQTEPLMNAALYHPVIDTFMRALPYTYRSVMAPEATRIRFTLTNLTGSWYLYRAATDWQLVTDIADQQPVTDVSIDGQLAWRLFTKGLTDAEAASSVTIEGDQSLGNPVLRMLSVMA
ncbi:maleylpyruvate isomerase N-terminal domain-containing protein [Fibrella aquatica]|uniref:maleylpyruvate isomerase N-terminal domain-containing protein n=1 Tax=Fibrella aquatica TaxID=3242487 RepID=UPI00351FF80D